MADIKAGIDLATAVLNKFADVAKKGIDYNATMESYRTSFEVMTGSAEKAAEVVERLRKMGAETPFETTDLVQTTQLLMQYGFTADDAISKMSMLGDIAQGNKEAMTSIATGYAQMSSAGKVNLQDIKQMINGGFNPLQEISERTGESMASLYDRISKGTMSIDEITQSMVNATSEGGKFYQSMEKQSQTLSGQLATLQDNANELLGSLTSGLSENLSSTVLPMVNNIIGELQGAFEKNGFQGLLDSATGMIPDLVGMMTGKLDDAMKGLLRWAPKLADALTASLPSVIKGLSSAIPTLTTALFEVASNVVSGLITMLPELVPALAEGIVNMVGSALTGIDKLVTGIFDGVEKLFHQGQEKIAGVWVDSENVKKYKIGLEAEVDTSEAETSIKTAYSTLRAALQTDLLTDEQKAEIIQMIGDDYDAIKAKLMEFGLSEEEAGALATQVSEAGDSLVKAYEGLNVGIDATTLARLTAQANGSRIVLKGLLKDVGLSDSDIAQVVSVYDTMTGKLGDQTPSIMEEIYDKLTDGEPDDEQTVSAIKEKIQTYIDGLLTELESTYAAKSAELDTTAADYKEKKAALDEWYNSTKTQITDMNTGMVALVDELAGAPTAVVEARMAEFAEMERTLLGVEEKIDSMTAKARTAAENAFQVVRSGANADEETIGLAINLKATEFKIDEQSAEDAYSAAVEDLNAKLASGEISKEEYDTQLESAQGDLEAAKAAAKAAYEKALGEIFAGIAESEGNDAALEQLQNAQNAQNLLDDMILSMVNGEQISEDAKNQVKEALAKALGDAFTSDDAGLLDTYLDSYNSGSDGSGFAASFLSQLAGDVSRASSDDLKAALGGKVGEAYSAALSSGFLTGTEFDTSEPTAQLSAILASIAQNAAPAAKAAGQSLGEETTSDMADAEGAQKAGNETVRGLDIALAKAEAKARRRGRLAGQAFARGYQIAQEVHSPSKVMMRLGRFSAEGLDIGLKEAMTKAVATAKMLSGQIVTAADFSQTLRVNVPNLNQEIKLANEQSSVPVNLDGQRIAEIQGLNNATRIEFLHRQDAKGYGL
nr:MAG TPA: tail tape measure protein [Caudoviricetes sp.]